MIVYKPNKAEAELKGIEYLIRPDTTDQQAIEEVWNKNVYQRRGKLEIEEGDSWLDIGGNIGAFAVFAASKGAAVVSYEPEPDNFELLLENMSRNGGAAVGVDKAVVQRSGKKVPLYLCKGDRNKYRHTLFQIRGRESIEVETIGFDEILKQEKPNGVKMDIEGAEIEILSYDHDWSGVDKLVFEYHFDRNRSVEYFYSIVRRLEKDFIVEHKKIPLGTVTYDWFPAAIIVYCYKNV